MSTFLSPSHSAIILQILFSSLQTSAGFNLANLDRRVYGKASNYYHRGDLGHIERRFEGKTMIEGR